MTLVRRYLWDLRLARAGVWERHAALSEGQAASLDDVSAEARARLTRLLQHAGEKVPYYRTCLAEAGVVRDGTVDLAAFARVPLLDKPTLRTRFDDLMSSDAVARGAFANTTGGSTGEPVRFLQDKETDQWKSATKLLFDEWTGYRRGERFALLWGAGHELDNPSLKSKLGTFLRNELRLNAYLMSPRVMDDYIAQINAFEPTLILAYAQSIYQLATHAERTGQTMKTPRAVMTSATNLDDAMRTTIERVFGTTVFDRYGSREVGDIACENGDGAGLLVSPLTHLVEVIGPDGQPAEEGVAGEIVVTLLTNYSMPLIRYRIGDAGTLGVPTGPIAWPRLTEVLGRVTDIFYTAGGDQVYGGYFTRQFYGQTWVSQFQVVQERYDHIVVLVVPSDDADRAAIEFEKSRIVTAIKGFMGQDCTVDFEIVETIPIGPTGKRRYTISKVGPPS